MNTERIKPDLISAISQPNNPGLLFEMSKLLDMSTDEEAVELLKPHIEETGNVLSGYRGEYVSHTEQKNQPAGSKIKTRERLLDGVSHPEEKKLLFF